MPGVSGLRLSLMIIRPTLPVIRLFAKPMAFAIVAALVTRSIVAAFTIPSGSMQPTLGPGDHILTVVYSWLTDPRKGDVVVFRQSGLARNVLIKRIVGVPGDEVTIIGGVVGVDGVTIGSEAGPEWRSRLTEGRIPDGMYCVIGDNRTDSIDSRHWGLVPRSSIIGEALLVYWSAGAEPAGGGNRALARTLRMGQVDSDTPGTSHRIPRWVH